MQIVVIGGGAAGFFAAIAAAESNPRANVVLLERGNAVLQKVRVSGGGRCNVTHDCPDARTLTGYYPRGSRELLGPFLRFGPTDTVRWFEAHGVRLKTEADGRMFPVTDSSQTIVDCLWQAARKAGVQVQTGARVDRLELLSDQRWQISIARQPPLTAHRIMLATGSSEAVWQMLGQLGHTIVPPTPSLFTFNIADARLRDLAGIAVPQAVTRIVGHKLSADGPVLITHWGLSGPAILRLSAWGARQLHELSYQFDLKINWLGEHPMQKVLDDLDQLKRTCAKKQIAAHAQFGLPARLWERQTAAAGMAPQLRWADADKKSLHQLAGQITEATFAVRGKSTFKEEFVTAGGVDLREIDFKTFSSKILPNCYLAGEMLNIDAITGGFNFQAAWTGGWIAGKSMSCEP
jgi:predicted Rossmann fold flavoprotein